MLVDYITSKYNNDIFTDLLAVQYCSSQQRYSTVCRGGIRDDEATIICKEQGYVGMYVGETFGVIVCGLSSVLEHVNTNK